MIAQAAAKSDFQSPKYRANQKNSSKNFQNLTAKHIVKTVLCFGVVMTSIIAETNTKISANVFLMSEGIVGRYMVGLKKVLVLLTTKECRRQAYLKNTF